MPLRRSVGSWLTLCLSSQLKQAAEQTKRFYIPGVAINEVIYGEWDCERRQRDKGRSDRSLMRWAEKRQRKKERSQWI